MVQLGNMDDVIIKGLDGKNRKFDKRMLLCVNFLVFFCFFFTANKEVARSLYVFDSRNKYLCKYKIVKYVVFADKKKITKEMSMPL